MFLRYYQLHFLNLRDVIVVKLKIKVGNYYELKLNERKIAFAVLYGFEKGKNKNIFSLMMYDFGKINFEFPIDEDLFNKWVSEERVQEITAEEALAYAF